MDLLLGIIYTEATVDAVLGGYFLVLGWRRRGDRDYLVFGLLCWLAGLYALFCIARYHADGSTTAVRWMGWRSVAGAMGAAMFVDFALRVAGRPRFSPQVTATMYGLSAATFTLSAIGRVVEADTLHRYAVTVLGRTLVFYRADYQPAVAIVLVGTSLGIAFATAAVTVAAWRGERWLRGIAVGSFVVLAAALHDVVAGFFHMRSIFVLEHAFSAFAFGASFVMTSRLAEELAHRTAELHQLSDTLRSVRETLEQREQLAAVGELSAIVAHEVRNPLAVIANAVASLRRENLADGDRRALLGILDEEAGRLNRIVGDLLQLARPVNAQMRALDPAELIERALAPARRARTHIEVEFQGGRAREPIRADGHLLRQALENLVDNAVQAMGGSGMLTVAVAAAERHGRAGREIAIIDTGEGMNTEIRKRARDPFFTTRSTGTGLGLAIVERIVRAHGGQMDIQSARSQGTTVRVWLPDLADGALPGQVIGTPVRMPAPEA